MQVLANSAAASILILLYLLRSSPEATEDDQCFARNGDAGDVLVVGIVA